MASPLLRLCVPMAEISGTLESFRFEDEDEALCFRHNEIFKLFRLQLGQNDEVDCNKIVTPSVTDLSMQTMSKSWTWSSFSSSSSSLKLANIFKGL